MNPEILKQLLGNFENGQETLQKANEIWSMLDDLAKNDKAAYQSFVSSNIEKFKESVPKNTPETPKILKINSHIFFLSVTLKVKAKSPKIIEENEQEAPKVNSKPSSLPDSFLLSINILRDKEVQPPSKPTTQNNALDLFIPFSFSKVSERKAKKGHYCLCLGFASQFIETVEKDGKLFSPFINYILSRVQNLLPLDFSPVMDSNTFTSFEFGQADIKAAYFGAKSSDGNFDESADMFYKYNTPTGKSFNFSSLFPEKMAEDKEKKVPLQKEEKQKPLITEIKSEYCPTVIYFDSNLLEKVDCEDGFARCVLKEDKDVIREWSINAEGKRVELSSEGEVRAVFKLGKEISDSNIRCKVFKKTRVVKIEFGG